VVTQAGDGRAFALLPASTGADLRGHQRWRGRHQRRAHGHGPRRRRHCARRVAPTPEELDAAYGPRRKTAFATRELTECLVRDADLVIGAVLITGAAAPRLVRKADVVAMRPGSALVDVAIDQGGCFETSRPRSPDDRPDPIRWPSAPR
jgi:hypothetical protein